MGAKGLQVREAEEDLAGAGGDACLVLPAPHQCDEPADKLEYARAWVTISPSINQYGCCFTSAF